MKYEVILFDIDDTLLTLENDGTWQRMFNILLKELGVETTDNMYKEFIQNNHRLWREAEDFKIPGSAVFDNRFDLPFLKNVGMSAEKVDFKFQEMQKKEMTPTKGALECCRKLSKNIKMYAASNGRQDTQNTRIRESILSNYITEVFTSDKVNALKPHNDFFEAILVAIGFKNKEKILMVGDTYGEDVLGAHNYGIDSCWLNAKGISIPESHLCKYEINNLGELPNLIK